MLQVQRDAAGTTEPGQSASQRQISSDFVMCQQSDTKVGRLRVTRTLTRSLVGRG
jgi:hypothetical protein